MKDMEHISMERSVELGKEAIAQANARFDMRNGGLEDWEKKFDHALCNAAIADYLKTVGEGVELPEPNFIQVGIEQGTNRRVQIRNYTAGQVRQAIAPYAARLKQAEDVLRMAREALGTGRIMSQDENGSYTREITPKVITDAIAAINQQLGEK